MTEPGDRIEGLTPLQRATLALKEMRVRLDAVEKARQEPLALVGIACRFPGGANDPEAYWQLLRQGVDGISDVPPGRWNADAFYDPAPGARGKMRVRRSGFLKGHDVDCFDAPFFGIAPIEANSLDPQHRLLLELTWEALEDAGLPAERLAGSRTGVFVGIATADYAQIVMRELGLEDVDGYVTTGNAANTAAGRLSYVLGSRGPAVALDTACSSSLVALHLACRSLRSGESDLALVGGVNLILTPDVNVLYSQMGALAPDGWCKSFDASADGMVRGEGGAVIAVKRLADALRDGDRVLALVRGSAVNHDGRSSGLSVPSGTAQREVLRSALADAGVMPAAVHLVEAHGTGTTLGDPIEAEALIAEMGAGRPDGTPLVLGAAKASIGHLEAAAGLAGLVKVALAMKHREIPPQMHFSSLNPEIAPGRFPLVVPTKPLPWPDSERPRIAGVSAFGVSGTNAHVILEAPRLADRKPGASDGEALPQPEAWLLPISARSAGALRELATAYEKIVTERRDVGLADLCFSAAVRRSHLEQRLAVVGRSREELAEGLAAFVRGELDPRFFKGALQPGRRPRLAFVFSGYGEPWPGMGRALLEREPAFREAIKGCDQEIGRHLSWSVHERLATGGAAAWEHPAMAQPLLFSVQVALAALWRSWGVEPAAVVGHSMGEIAAAHVAGALSLEDATLLVCRRSEIVRRAPGKGAMAVVGLSLAQALEALAGYEDRLGVSVCNGRALVVLSGEPEALHDVVAGLAHRNVFTRLMKEGAAAAHSPQMDAVLPELLAALQGLVPRATQVPLYSTVTAALSEGETLGPEYWARNLREPVLFAQTIEQIGNDGYDAFLEISPHPMLLGAIEQVLRPQGGEIALAPSLKSDEPEEATLRASAGRLWTAGVPMDFGRLYPAGRFVPLPRYPWQRQRYWVGSRPAHALQASSSPARAGAPHPLLDRLIASARAPGEILGELEIDEDRLPFLGALRLQGVGIVPVPVLAEMALAAASALPLDAAAVVEDLVVHDQILLDGGGVLQIAASPAAEGHVFQIFNRPRCGDGEWTACASGRLLPACSDPPAGEPVEAVRGRCAAPADVASIASQSFSRGLDRGAALRCVEQLSCAAGEALACLELPEGAGAGTFALHPAFLDGVFQVLSALADDPEVPPVPGEVALPTGLGRLVVHRPGLLVGSLLCHAVLRSAGGPANEILGDARLLDESGALVAEISGARLRPPGRRVARQIVSELLPTWRYAMVWEPRTELPSAGEGGQQPLAPGYWLVLADRSGLGTALAAEMRQRGDEVLLVQTGPGLSTPAQGPWEVPAEGSEAWDGLLAAARGRGTLRGIVHLLGLDAPSPEQTTIGELQMGGVGALSALHLIRALARSSTPARLWLVTRGAQPVLDGSPSLAVAQAPLWGLGKVIALEHPDLWGRLIDLDPVAPEDEAAALLAQIDASDGEDFVALRGGVRHVLRLVHGEDPEPAAAPLALRPDATYLVTGGLGGAGLQVAQWLVDRGARHLALMSRRGLPPRDAWAQLPPGSDARQQAQAVMELEARGAAVRVIRADVGDLASLEGALASLNAGGTPLKGIIHTAGLTGQIPLASTTAEDLRSMLRPKVAGTWALHLLTRGLDLDFFACFSSPAGVWGAAMLGTYAAANHFMDVFAHYRRAVGLPAVSIAWGGWGGGGMATAEVQRYGAQMGLGTMPGTQAVEALDAAIQGSAAQVTIAPVDWRLFKPLFEARRRFPLLDSIEVRVAAAPEGEQMLVKRLEQSEPHGRWDLLVAHVREAAAGVLGIADPLALDRQQGFFQMGMDSMMSVRLRTRLEESLGKPLPPTLAFEHPTVDAVAGYLAREVLGDLLPPEPPRASERPGARAQAEASLDGLSADELNQLLAAELGAPRQEERS